jgi:hypothetical protein
MSRLIPALLLVSAAALAATVNFHGVDHTSIGNATLTVDPGPNVLIVANINGDGMATDGVRLDPWASAVPAEKVHIQIGHPEVLSWIQTHEVTHSSGTAAATSTYDGIQSFPVSWSADFTGEGFTHYAVDYYLNNSLIHVDNEIPAGTSSSAAKIYPDEIVIQAPASELDARFTGKYLTQPAEHSFKDGGTGFADEIRFRPINLGGPPAPGPPTNAPAAVLAPVDSPPVVLSITLLADGMPEFTIVNETYDAPTTGVESPPGWDPRIAASPNPFQGRTSIRFSLSRPGRVLARIFDLEGRLIREWPARPFGAGENEIAWDGRDAAGRAVLAGVYFGRIEVDVEGRRSGKAVRLLKL